MAKRRFAGAGRPLLLRAVVTFLLLFSSIAMAGGGTWKMGPFGPYWDDNSWPEFTPMYWMEEFLNQLDDDDAEIQQWMMRNQYQGSQQPPLQQDQGTYPQQNSPAIMLYNNVQPYSGNMPDSSVPMDMPEQWRELMPGQGSASPNRPRNDIRPGAGSEYSSRNRASSYARRPAMPRRTDQAGQARRQEMPAAKPDPRSAYPEFAHLPNLTPQEFSSMPPQLQQQYEHAFNQALSNFERRREIEEKLRNRPPVYDRQRGRSFPR